MVWIYNLACSSLFQPITSIFQPIPTYSSLFQPVQVYCSLFQPVQVYSSLFRPILAYFSLLQPWASSKARVTSENTTEQHPKYGATPDFQSMAGLGRMGKSGVWQFKELHGAKFILGSLSHAWNLTSSLNCNKNIWTFKIKPLFPTLWTRRVLKTAHLVNHCSASSSILVSVSLCLTGPFLIYVGSTGQPSNFFLTSRFH